MQDIPLVHLLLGDFEVDFRGRGFGGVLFWREKDRWYHFQRLAERWVQLPDNLWISWK
jgi:hypothetical protein